MLIRRLVLVLATLALLAPPVPAIAQESLKDSIRTEAVRSRGFIRGSETQATKVIEMIERLNVNADGSVDTFVVYDTVPGDTVFATDLVPDSAPPEWRVPEPEADSTSPTWIGDGRRLYTFWAWGDSAASWNETGDTLTIKHPLDRAVIHVWPVFQRDLDLWVPTGDGWRPATIHPSRPWVCVHPDDEAESYSVLEKIVAAGIAVGLKVVSWLNPDDPGLAQGLNRLPPDCPADAEPEPPATDSGPPPMPANVSLAGYAAPDAMHPRENGLHIEWSAAPAGTDSIVVDGGPNGPGDTFTRVLPGTATSMRQPLAYDSVTSMWTCVKYQRDGVNGAQRCTSFDWPPMVRTFLAVTMRVGDAPLAVGDEVNLELHRVDRGWADGTIAPPDSVVFEADGVRHREALHPFRFPGDDALFAVPAGDSLIVKWTLFSGPGSMGGSVAYPIQ